MRVWLAQVWNLKCQTYLHHFHLFLGSSWVLSGFYSKFNLLPPGFFWSLKKLQILQLQCVWVEATHWLQGVCLLLKQACNTCGGTWEGTCQGHLYELRQQRLWKHSPSYHRKENCSHTYLLPSLIALHKFGKFFQYLLMFRENRVLN